MAKWFVGETVKATRTITECDGAADESAAFPSAGYIHARAGDVGRIEYVDSDGAPTVRFARTGTATVVGDHEIERMENVAQN